MQSVSATKFTSVCQAEPLLEPRSFAAMAGRSPEQVRRIEQNFRKSFVRTGSAGTKSSFGDVADALNRAIGKTALKSAGKCPLKSEICDT